MSKNKVTTFSNGIKRIPKEQTAGGNVSVSETDSLKDDMLGIYRNSLSTLKRAKNWLGIEPCGKCGH